MTPQERTERARRAKLAMDEFFTPAFDVVEGEWYAEMIRTARSTDPRRAEVVMRLTDGIAAVRAARQEIERIIADGDVAVREIARDEKLDEMTAPKRRLASIGQV